MFAKLIPMRFRRLRTIFAFILAFPAFAQTTSKHLLQLDDLYREHPLSELAISSDGNWVAYTAKTMDRDADKRISEIWMANWNGGQDIQLTYDPEGASSPKWSPDGKYLSFLSSRTGKAKGSQIWLLDRRGGEAHQLTHLKNLTITSYDWSPDSKRLLFVLREKDEPDDDDAKPSDKPKSPKPVVIDRYHFKEDVEGYLSDHRNHIYLFEIASEKLDQITKDDFDETDPAFSPDGSRIAFVSNQDKDPDRSKNTDIFVVEARAGAIPKRLTNYSGPDSGRLSWSPDSTLIAYLQGSEPKYNAYNLDHLALVPASGGPPRILTANFDRGISLPVFSTDGQSVYVIVADDGSEYPAKVSVADGAVERLTASSTISSDIHSRSGHTAFIASSDYAPNEVFAFDGGSTRKISQQHNAFAAELQLGKVEDISFKAKDGTEVHALLTKPPNYESGKRYPMLLRIHGGPSWQSGHDFNFERQWFAANGFVVLNVNYRGSYGRGQKYGESIFGDWGNKEVLDLHAAVDYVVASGIADPNRLGVGGWSYGGILTDYLIASDTRFKAAISGAGSANQISMYGVNEYVFQYNTEIGEPWRATADWLKVSYPFFKADKIKTPTLFMGGDKDFNVPLVGGEQMYEALKTLGVPTELVVYPGEFHEFTRPSFIRDRFERYLAWYDKYLK